MMLSACSSGPDPSQVVIQGTAVPAIPTLAQASIRRGEELYLQFCASCHGVNLEGQSNWQLPSVDGSYPAPPHDSSGHTWHHPDSLLEEVIVQGGDRASGSQMPPFGEKLGPEDIVDLLSFIKSRWGMEQREFQWWITARDRSQ
jgi:mono/diheme cytochrome c family protein